MCNDGSEKLVIISTDILCMALIQTVLIAEFYCTLWDSYCWQKMNPTFKSLVRALSPTPFNLPALRL